MGIAKKLPSRPQARPLNCPFTSYTAAYIQQLFEVRDRTARSCLPKVVKAAVDSQKEFLEEKKTTSTSQKQDVTARFLLSRAYGSCGHSCSQGVAARWPASNRPHSHPRKFFCLRFFSSAHICCSCMGRDVFLLSVSVSRLCQRQRQKDGEREQDRERAREREGM